MARTKAKSEGRTVHKGPRGGKYVLDRVGRGRNKGTTRRRYI